MPIILRCLISIALTNAGRAFVEMGEVIAIQAESEVIEMEIEDARADVPEPFRHLTGELPQEA